MTEQKRQLLAWAFFLAMLLFFIWMTIHEELDPIELVEFYGY